MKELTILLVVTVVIVIAIVVVAVIRFVRMDQDKIQRILDDLNQDDDE